MEGSSETTGGKIKKSLESRNKLNKDLGRNLSKSDLEVGDIILTRSKEVGSALIRAGTLSSYSHAMIFIGYGLVIHAEPPDPSSDAGVKVELLDYAFLDIDHAAVFRHSQANERNTDLLRKYLVEQLGKPYDNFELLGPKNVLNSGFSAALLRQGGGFTFSVSVTMSAARYYILLQGDRKAFFCSELVYAAYRNAGIPIATGNPSGFSPGDMEKSDTLFFLGVLKEK